MVEPTPTQTPAPQSSESLARWLVSGLLAGIAVLGVAVAAYAVGYNRGQHHRHTAAVQPGATTTQATTAPAGTTPTTTAAPTTAAPSPALAAHGKQLYTADACSGCHSLTATAGAGPGFKGLAGSTVTLDNGQTVTADTAYLERSITDPDAQIVKGFRSGLMSAAVASYHLAAKPNDVAALVAFIQAQK